MAHDLIAPCTQHPKHKGVQKRFERLWEQKKRDADTLVKFYRNRVAKRKAGARETADAKLLRGARRKRRCVERRKKKYIEQGYFSQAPDTDDDDDDDDDHGGSEYTAESPRWDPLESNPPPPLALAQEE
jgi:hypothetical protein